MALSLFPTHSPFLSPCSKYLKSRKLAVVYRKQGPDSSSIFIFSRILKIRVLMTPIPSTYQRKYP
jgi:hypothetical protein